MDKFNDLQFQEQRLIKLVERFSDGERKKVLKALELAKKAHEGQKRDEGTEYVIHLIRIASCLIEELGVKDVDVVCGGVIHDIVEDTDVTQEHVVKQFGQSVGNFVKALTRDKSKDAELGKFKSKKLNMEKLRKAGENIRLLKAVDYLDNLRSFMFRKDLHTARYNRHLREVKEIYIPMAESVSEYVVEKMKKVLDKLPKPKVVETNDPKEKL